MKGTFLLFLYELNSHACSYDLINSNLLSLRAFYRQLKPS